MLIGSIADANLLDTIERAINSCNNDLVSDKINGWIPLTKFMVERYHAKILGDQNNPCAVVIYGIMQGDQKSKPTGKPLIIIQMIWSDRSDKANELLRDYLTDDESGEWYGYVYGPWVSEDARKCFDKLIGTPVVPTANTCFVKDLNDHEKSKIATALARFNFTISNIAEEAGEPESEWPLWKIDNLSEDYPELQIVSVTSDTGIVSMVLYQLSQSAKEGARDFVSIYAVWTDPEQQRNNLATLLITGLLNKYPKNQYRYSIWCYNNNIAGKGLYNSLGFKLNGIEFTS